MKNLLLIRGMPGSGKSTLADVLSERGKYPVFSIDDYFTDEEGHYEFIFKDNHLAYEHCIMRTENAMKSDAEKILVENVFSLEWEMEPYLRLASDHGYMVHVLTLENRHNGKNRHGVTDEQLKKMASKFKVQLIP